MNKCSRCNKQTYKFFIFKGRTYCHNCVDKVKAKAFEKRIMKAKNG